jgi:hypothetical protein
MLPTSLRVRCRNQRCRSKLSTPTSNDHKAFCTRYCYDQFYHLKCAVCEKPVAKRPRGKTPKWCIKRDCRLTYNRHREAFSYNDPSTRELTQEVPVSQGVKPESKTSDLTFRVVAGPPHLSPSPGNGYPTNVVGGYKFPQATDKDLRPVSALWAALLPGSALTHGLENARRLNEAPPTQTITPLPCPADATRVRIQLHDEAPGIGSGIRFVYARTDGEWVHLSDHYGRTARLKLGQYQGLKPTEAA